MNYEKTGTLIAEKRKKLNLTQKELGDRLNVSDRTISKWERGAGFPDISLIESVAEELEMSVLELLHGEEEELTEREKIMVKRTLDEIEPEVKGKMKKLKIALVALSVIIVVLLVLFLSFRSKIKNENWVGMEDVTVVEAVSVMQDIIITDEDDKLIEKLIEDENVKAYYNAGNDSLAKSNVDISRYKNMFDIRNDEVKSFIVQADKNKLYVEYGSDYVIYSLTKEEGGDVVKEIIKYGEPYRTDEGLVPAEERKEVYHLENYNNDTFRMSIME